LGLLLKAITSTLLSPAPTPFSLAVLSLNAFHILFSAVMNFNTKLINWYGFEVSTMKKIVLVFLVFLFLLTKGFLVFENRMAGGEQSQGSNKRKRKDQGQEPKRYDVNPIL
jgi:hypothetical protein